MKNINFPALLIALLVVAMFCLVGVAISFKSYFFIFFFLLLGSLIMGFGIRMKRKSIN